MTEFKNMSLEEIQNKLYLSEKLKQEQVLDILTRILVETIHLQNQVHTLIQIQIHGEPQL
jgi:hypothetical protein